MSDGDVERRSLRKTFRDVTAITAGAALASTAGCLELWGLGGGGPAGGPMPGAQAPTRQDVTIDDADVVVDTTPALERALSGEGQTIWIPDGTVLDLTGRNLELGTNTLASARSENARGAILTTTDRGTGSPVRDNALVNLNTEGGRLTGVVVRGPLYDYTDSSVIPGYVPMAPGSTWAIREEWRSNWYCRGVSVQANNTQIDNCEIWGWSTGIMVGRSEVAASPNILWCSIHNCMMTSAGYPIDVYRGIPTVYMCFFDAYRHAIAGYGFGDGGYRCVECTFGPHCSSFPIDMHGIHNNARDGGSSDPSNIRYRWRAGGTMLIRNCDIMPTSIIDDSVHNEGEGYVNFAPGATTPHAKVRAVPADGFYFEGNRCAHPDPETGVEQTSVPGRYDTNQFGWHNIFVDGNEWGVDFSDGGGAGRGGVSGGGGGGGVGGGENIFASPMDSPGEIGRFPTTSHTNNISVVSDPAGTGRGVVAIHVPQNETRGGTLAYAPNETRDGSRTGENDPDSGYVRYSVYFPEGTQMYDPSESNHGTKLPGLAGFYTSAGNGGRAGDGHSWSLRTQTEVVDEDPSNSAFRMNYYSYHMDQERSDGFGDLEPWTGTYEFGKWHDVVCFVRMNTPGKSDGVARAWMNDNRVFNETNYRFRSTDHPHAGITRAYAAYIHWGGDWGSPQDQNVYFKNFSYESA